MVESEIVIQSGDTALAATLTLPDRVDGPLPAVLCIHGSGPLDRNENMRGQALNVFNAVAAHLARRGIATLRYDKRGCGASEGDYHAAGLAELIADGRAGLEFLRRDPRFSALYLLGHSEGTVIAPLVQVDGGVAGGVLLCPFIDDVETLLAMQAAHVEEAVQALGGIRRGLARAAWAIFGRPTAQQADLIARIRSSSEPVVRFRFRRIPAKWLRELLALDPRALFARIDVPTLIVGGDKDVQCGADAPGKIAAIIGARAECCVLPDLTHVLRRDPSRHTILSYPALIRQPVDAEVLEIVGAWLQRQAGS